MRPDAHLIYKPVKNKPMNIAVFASGGGNNLLTAIKIAHLSLGKICVCLVVTDRLAIPAIDIAKSHGIPVIAKDFEKECGVWGECKNDPIKAQRYRMAGERFHDAILEQMLDHENIAHETIDLIVLSYHRLIQGKLLRHFNHRIINQHPGDLTIMQGAENKQRKYVGLSPVFDALRDGNSKTRTVNFLVGEGCDDGEILCSGPWVTYKGKVPVTRESALLHEMCQKKMSDRPCLMSVLIAIAEGRLGISIDDRHPDGRYVTMLDNKKLPYGGYDLSIKDPISFRSK